MAQVQLHLVRVITDDRSCRLYVAAAPREEAVTRVLAVVPEGWSASLLDAKVKPSEAKVLDLARGEVRELGE
jgi:hypothetical protein